VKVLLDEHFSPDLRHEFPGHEVVTTAYAGWSGFKNGDLLLIAEQSGYEVFVTADQNLSYQQNLESRTIAIVVLSAHSWKIIRNHLPAIRAAIDAALPGSFQLVECGEFRRK
jgi:hypothetical protein